MADTANTTLAVTSASTGTTTSAGGWRTEDWIAVILGFLVLAAVLAAFQWKVVDLRYLVQTYRWTTDGQIASFSASWTRSLDAIIAEAQAQKQRSEEHTSELQSLRHLVCRLLLEKKKRQNDIRRS